MNYHLNRNGQNLGIFSLEELQRRRAAGELTGTELVWTQGMTDWQPLNAILPPGTPGPISPPPRIQETSKSNRALVWVLVIVGFFFAMFLVLGIIVFVEFGKVVQPSLRALQETGGGSFAQSRGMQAASKPVIVGSNTLTVADVNRTGGEFRVRQYLDAYKLHGQRNPEYDTLALGMISNWIACNYGGVVDTNLPSLEAMGHRLATDPQCNDPVLLTVAAMNTVELHESIRRLERAVRGFQGSPYSGYPKFYATEMLADKLIYDRNDRLPVLDAQALLELQGAFSDGSIRPEDQPIIAEILISGWGHSFFSRNELPVCAMAQQLGKQYHWLALVLQGEDEINEAWAARGDGYVNSVSQSGWKGFNQHLGSAREYYSLAWELNTNWALAPDRMMTVSLGDSDITEMRKWFDRTVAVQIDYADAWSEMRWGLRPRWYGDTDSMLAFGVTALNTGRFDTDVPRKFFDSVSDVESELDMSRGEHIYDHDNVWPYLKQMYEGYIGYPSQTAESRDGWRSTYSVIAYLAGEYGVARQQLQQLNWRPHSNCLTGWGRDLSLMPLEVAARTGPCARLVENAERKRRNGDIAGALKIYDELLAGTDADNLTRAFARDRQYSLGVEQHLAAGEWVPFLPPDAAFTGWQTNFGSFKLLPDGALEASSDENGHMIYCRANIGRDFEIRGQFEVISSTTKAFQAGVVMGIPQFSTFDWDAFRIKRNTDEGDVASVSEHWTKRQIVAPLNNLDNRSNSFDFCFQGGKVTAAVNGHAIFVNTDPPENDHLGTNEFLVGLGAFNDSNSTVVHYRDVEIRRLSAEKSVAAY